MVGMRHIDDLPAADSLRAIFLGCAVLSPSTRDQQLTLRRIKRLAAAGNSPRKISSDLAERGVVLSHMCAEDPQPECRNRVGLRPCCRVFARPFGHKHGHRSPFFAFRGRF
jgi:hypothetical protein